SPFVALGDLSVEQQAEPFGMGEIGALWIGLRLGKSPRHSGKSELVHLVKGGVDQQGNISSMVIAGAADVGMVGQQLALACRLRRLSIEPVFEDRLDRAVGTGADIQTAIAGRLQPLGAVLARQPQDAEASAVALFRMWPALQDQRGELGSARANRRRLTADPLDRPFGVTPVRARHVLGDCRMPTATGAA